jgi:hypothetical protein
VFEHIVNAPGNANVTEWCKKEECWKKLQEKNINIPQRLMQELLEFNQRNGSIIAGKGEWEVSDEDREIVSELSNISPDVWFKLSAWAKQTDNLQPWQRGIAYSMGSLLARGSKPSRKQTEHSVKILDEAKRLGFTV